jgi:hypothetical protein
MGIGGTVANQFGHLTATRAAHSTPLRLPATLRGTLNLNVVNGFSPAIGNTLQVMTFGSRTGQFATVNGLVIGNGNQFSPVNSPSAPWNLTLNVVAAPFAPNARFQFAIASDGIAGSVANGNGNRLQLSGLTHSASGVRFHFPAIAGSNYRLEGTPDLSTGQWTPLLEIEGTGELLEILDTGTSGLKQYFYRIVPLP